MTYLVAVALLLRLGSVAINYDDMRWQNDQRVSIPAVRILEGKGMSLEDGAGFTAYRPPLYVLWLSGNYAVFGVHALVGPSAMQALVSTGNVVLLFLLARQLWKREDAALAAAAILAVHPYTVWHDAALYHTFLSTAFLLAALTLLLKAWDTRRARLFFASGLLFGLAVLVLGVIAPFVALLVLALAVALRKQWKSGAMLVGAFVLGLALTWGPWVIRNAVAYGEFVPLTTESGVTLWMGNNPESGWRMPQLLHEASPVPAGTRFNIPWFYEYCREPVSACVGGISEAQETKELAALAMGWIRENPGEFIKLSAWRMGGIWSPFLTPTKNVLPHPTLNALLLWTYATWNTLLYALMLIGTWRAWQEGKKWQTATLLFLAISATGLYALFLYYTKYRIPFEAILLPLAGGGLTVVVKAAMGWKGLR